MIELAQPLVKIMSDRVATSFESEGFIQALVEVQKKLGLHAERLVKCMCGTVAARIMKSDFLPVLLLLPKRKTDQKSNLTSNAVRSVCAVIPIKRA